MIPLLRPNDPFPPVSKAVRSPNGLLCAGADLSPQRLLDAYSKGIFPWFSEGDPILWWSPHPRMVLFPGELIRQEVSTEQYIEIPEPVREIYKLWRPTPLVRARRLEQALGTPAHIYYKNESVSPAGSHKPNTAIPQALYNRADGTRAMTTETGFMWWASLGPGSSQTEQGSSFTLARYSRSALFSLLFKAHHAFDLHPYSSD